MAAARVTPPTSRLTSPHLSSDLSVGRTLGGVRLAITSHHREILEILHSRLANLPGCSASPADVRIEVAELGERDADDDQILLASCRTVYEPPQGKVLYHEATDTLTTRVGERIRARCVPSAGHARIAYDGGDAAALWLAAYPVLNLCLVELLRRHGLFNVHAAAVSLAGRGLLIAGRSGAGKSTLTVALLRDGFAMLGDDTSFLRLRGCQIDVVAYPDEIDVADETIEFFPELAFLRARAKRPGSTKHQLQVWEAFRGGVERSCVPAAVILPQITHAATSALESISGDEALLELMSSVLVTERSSTQAHLDAIGALVRRTPCFRLRTGRDVETVPSLLRGLL